MKLPNRLDLSTSNLVMDLDIVPSPTFLQNHIETMSQNYMSQDRPLTALKNNNMDLSPIPIKKHVVARSEWNGSPAPKAGFFRQTKSITKGNQLDKISTTTPEKFRASHQGSVLNEFMNKV